ncbi:MAG: nicotinate-nucleotide--dimethylbenzimidazole phosphoribosyltransferase [Acidimicrobiia bacterium]|jgi:nicotinate-nucleotide--dimethylbenzimidazole phosphoribosyltransferase|nr:nicotinate-nucleotide--dimethylbenzimidazole phosphoribosyltransferase [Acidimicrobiia bacterium]
MTADAGPFAGAAGAVLVLDDAAAAEATARQDRLTKPRGSLGRLETLGVRLAAIAGTCPPPLPHPAAVAIFAADHGVVARGVSPWPPEVTAQMVANFAAGGAAINVLARQAGASVTVVDVGVATPLPDDLPASVLRRAIRPGTADMTVEAAMTAEECRAALDVGATVAADLVAGGARALVTGEMGIANTTAAAAVIAALLGRDPESVTGRGTGVDDDGLVHKMAVVEAALARHAPAVAAGPEATLAAVGGLEIAALVGFVVGGAAAAVPVVVDGVIADAALLVAERLVPGVADRCIAGHRSTEPGAAAVLDALGLEPLLDLGLRLGEGSGACLALGVLEAAARLLSEMATFESAGVTDEDR